MRLNRKGFTRDTVIFQRRVRDYRPKGDPSKASEAIVLRTRRLELMDTFSLNQKVTADGRRGRITGFDKKRAVIEIRFGSSSPKSYAPEMITPV